MDKKIILHIVPGFLYGGVESRLIDWYSCINHQKIQFDVIKVTPDTPNNLVDRFEEMGGHVFSIPPLGTKTVFKHIQAVKYLMEKTPYDAVHAHSLEYGLIPLLYAKKMGIQKRVLHNRAAGFNPNEKHILLSKILGKFALWFATDFFACSEEAGKWAFGDNRPVKVIRNGIHLDEFRFDIIQRQEKRDKLQINDRLVLGFVGRFSTAKNVLFLLDVLKNVVDNHDNSVLIMVGDDKGDLAEEFKHKAFDLGLLEHILFAGRQDHVQGWYQIFDVFLLPSHFEGFGTVTIEAQANGLPCIVSNGVPKSVKVTDEVSFLDITDPIPWAQKCLSYVGKERKPGQIERIREAGYDAKRTAEELEAFYLSVK